MTAFAGAGKAVGIEVWRLEKLEPVRWTQPGAFYSGDAYLVLHTIKIGSRYNLYYWIGKNCSVDEKGGIAYSAVELDQCLGDVPVQYREVQNHESGGFVTLWKEFGGLRYMEGGVDSAFHHVAAEEYTPRLLHVKGKRAVRVREVKLSSSSLNDGDAFILDAGLTLYSFNGKDVNRYEKIKAAEVIRFIQQERGGKAEIFKMAEANPAQWSAFWDLLGGEQPIKAADTESDDMHDLQSKELLLYTLEGEAYVASERSAPYFRKDFCSSNICLLDTNSLEGLFVWIGNKSEMTERKMAMQLAEDYLRQRDRSSASICRLHEGCETALFKSHVSQFEVPRPKQWSPNVVASMRESEVDISAMHTERVQAKEISLRNRAEETIQVWRVENFDLVEIPSQQHGEFYDGDSYVIEYVYQPKNGRGEQVLYFWQGLHSTVDEKGAVAMFVTKMDEERHQGRAVQVRVPMGKEPLAFCLLFNGKMIIHKGGAVSGFRSSSKDDTAPATDVRLYHIRGESPMECKAIQVYSEAASLHSNDVFVLVHEDTAFLWRGHGASQEEEMLGEDVCSRLCSGRVQIVKENEEPAGFWELLGGKDEYASDPVMCDPSFQPRLFSISNATGALRCEEIFNFTQQDLLEEDVMLLDVKTAVFVWIGRLAHRDEIKEASRVAEQYIATTPDNRNVSMMIIHQGYEPLLFTSHFNWDESPSEVKRAFSEAPAITTEDTYPLETLQRELPPNVPSTEKENFLSDDDFQRVFSMPRADFAKLPPWKKTDLKKKAQLF